MDVVRLLLGDRAFPARLASTRLIVMADEQAYRPGSAMMPPMLPHSALALPPGKSVRAVPLSGMNSVSCTNAASPKR